MILILLGKKGQNLCEFRELNLNQRTPHLNDSPKPGSLGNLS